LSKNFNNTGHSPQPPTPPQTIFECYISKIIYCLKIKELQAWNDKEKNRIVFEEYLTAEKIA
jgi:hypothetical protein